MGKRYQVQTCNTPQASAMVVQLSTDLQAFRAVGSHGSEAHREIDPGVRQPENTPMAANDSVMPRPIARRRETVALNAAADNQRRQWQHAGRQGRQTARSQAQAQLRR